MSEPVYTTLQQIVDQLEYCGYESKESFHRLENNVAFIALKDRAAAEQALEVNEALRVCVGRIERAWQIITKELDEFTKRKKDDPN